MKQTERSAVLGFLLILLVAVLMGPGCKPTSSAERTASVKERLAVVEQASAIEPFEPHCTFTVVFSYGEDIPEFQKIILSGASSSVEEPVYFTGLAPKSVAFRPGEEVLVFKVAYHMNEARFTDRFLLIRKKE